MTEPSASGAMTSSTLPAASTLPDEIITGQSAADDAREESKAAASNVAQVPPPRSIFSLKSK